MVIILEWGGAIMGKCPLIIATNFLKVLASNMWSSLECTLGTINLRQAAADKTIRIFFYRKKQWHCNRVGNPIHQLTF